MVVGRPRLVICRQRCRLGGLFFGGSAAGAVCLGLIIVHEIGAPNANTLRCW